MNIYYPAKIWLAFGETFSEKGESFVEWLMKNGYPELGALSHAIRGSEQALEWLMRNKFLHLAALDGAIDENQKAYKWLADNQHPLLVLFADACHGALPAIDWFKRHNLSAFLVIAGKIKEWRDSQTFDYHKLHF
jgi:hypothetical protein